MKKRSPICLFTYNRLEETKQTLDALKRNYLAGESELFIFSDGPKNPETKSKVDQVRVFLKTVEGFKNIRIYESYTNQGLANSIISGVSKILNTYDTVIVLEDDLITTPNFLDFMNDALDYYKSNNSIYTINGYSPLIKGLNDDHFYLHSRSFPWGWATWKHSWEPKYFDEQAIKAYLKKHTDGLQVFKQIIGEDAVAMLMQTLEGKISSWYIRWVFGNFIEGKKSVFPVLSKVQNIGDSEDATHYNGGISAYKCQLDTSFKTCFSFEKTIELELDDKRFLKFFTKKHKFLYRLKLLTSITGSRKIYKELQAKVLD
ncbi:glycosyltransferase [Leeuwenhoekiella marinoflava]|uniref:glycosyltransferase n=1 Tax=Leeuwenhoekiella marinoflava TaxID=988 RepID=UPI00300276A0